MTQGYKCDNCTTFKERKEDIKEHEKECSFNPNNKKCDTCINFVNIEYSLDMECSKFSHDHQEEKGMKGLCKSWELEK